MKKEGLFKSLEEASWSCTLFLGESWDYFRNRFSSTMPLVWSANLGVERAVDSTYGAECMCICFAIAAYKARILSPPLFAHTWLRSGAERVCLLPPPVSLLLPPLPITKSGFPCFLPSPPPFSAALGGPPHTKTPL